MLTCKTCGEMLPDGTSFCSRCGTAISYETAQPMYTPESQQMYGQQPYPPQYTPEQPNYGGYSYCAPTPTSPGVGKSVVSMVMGILSILFLCSGFSDEQNLFFLNIPFGIIGLVFGCIARKEASMRNQRCSAMATAGITCSIIGLGLFLIMFILIMVLGAALMGVIF